MTASVCPVAIASRWTYRGASWKVTATVSTGDDWTVTLRSPLGGRCTVQASTMLQGEPWAALGEERAA